ncbi:ankyrin repeat protein [Xylariaceae sp. FL1019]|nr:ankyrin repeat protein [Xylariaceae sp. FL1019]
MASRADYTVGWICAIPMEMAAAKATLDQIHPELPLDPGSNDTNAYVLGSLCEHNVVIACLPFGVYGTTSATTVVIRMLASFESIRFTLKVGIGGGVPCTKEDIRLGDVVVSKPTTARPGIIQYDFGKKCSSNQLNVTGTLNKPSTLLLTAAGKVETNAILGESQIPNHVSKIVHKDPSVFAHPGLEQDVVFDADYEHTPQSIDNTCSQCDSRRACYRPPRETQDPKIIRDGAARDMLAREYGILCFETEAAGLMDTAQCLVIRGICDYADSHKSKRWQGYAAAVAAAYAKEILSLIPAVSPEVDRSSLIALKGRRVQGTCEWLTRHPSYLEWLKDAEKPLLWISGGPGKGKTMLAIYITEELQQVVNYQHDKARNTALSIMRGILHQWLTIHAHLAPYLRHYFDGTETTKYTISHFTCLWRLFLILLRRSGPSQVALVLDGLDECEENSLRQLLDALREYLSEVGDRSKAVLKVIILSRPQPGLLVGTLRPFLQVKFDDSEAEVGQNVERYISAKVAELASEQILSASRLEQIRQALMAHADGTFLWVGWLKVNDVLRSIPKGLAGIYRRLLEQVEDKDKLVTILQWVVLAARPMRLNELATAAEIKASDTLTPIDVLKDRLASCGLLSAREFLQSDQVNTGGIKIFHMNGTAHRTLLRTCLALLERSFKFSRDIYWPEHFQHAVAKAEVSSEFSRQFFQAQTCGAPPSFTLLHLAAYFGNVAWAQMLLKKDASDSLGRTALFWAATRGHKGMVELLLEHGADINTKDQSKMTPLHIAVTREHKEVVSLLLERSARIEEKALYGETPLIRAIQTSSRDIVQLLIEHGARVDGLPIPSGLTTRTSPHDFANQLMGLHKQLVDTRHKSQSRQIDVMIKVLKILVHFSPMFKLGAQYVRRSQHGRWEMYNETSRMQKWTQSFTTHGIELVEAKNAKHFMAAADLVLQILDVIASEDLEPLLTIGMLVGPKIMLSAVKERWREGIEIACRTFYHVSSLAHRTGTEESVIYGIRQFLVELDDYIRNSRREESANGVMALLSALRVSLPMEDPWPADCGSIIITEFVESYIGGDYEGQVFHDFVLTWVYELDLVIESPDSRKLFVLLSAMMHLTKSATEKGRGWFLNALPVACQILCQNSPSAWLMGQEISVVMSKLISQQVDGPIQKQGFKSLMECLIIGKQYGLSLPSAVQETVRQNLGTINDVSEMLEQVFR